MLKKLKLPQGKEGIIAILWAMMITVGSSHIYYRAVYGLIPGVLVGLYALSGFVKRADIRHKQKLLGQFKNMIIAMQSAMEAGKSMENSLVAANRELKLMYGRMNEITRALDILEKRMKLNISLDEALREFSETMDLAEIYDFVQVISTIKKTGGNAIKVIGDTVEKIVSEIELREELEVMVAAKKLEQQIMIYMPAAIILFLRITVKDFLSPLYGNPIGIILMTIALVVNVAADYLGKRIVDIN